MATNAGQFSKSVVTTAGKEMIVQAQNGHTLTFTRVALGDGTLAEGEDMLALAAVKSERLSADISSFVDKGNGQFQLKFNVNNSTLTTGFWHREIGVMAKIDDGDETLYAYSYAGAAATFLYDNTTPIQERLVNIDVLIGNATNVTVVIDGSVVYLTRQDVEMILGNFITKVQTPAYNKRNTITTSGTYTAPVTGWYKLTLKGGGGGGQGANYVVNTFVRGGAGGGEGGTTIAYEHMSAGDSVNVTIGAGGSGTATVSGSQAAPAGGMGGTTTVIVNGNTYSATGGNGGYLSGGNGGTGTIRGACGTGRVTYVKDAMAYTAWYAGGVGGGAGGQYVGNGLSGSGGGGGTIDTDVSPVGIYAGGDGGNGYVWFEYWAD